MKKARNCLLVFVAACAFVLVSSFVFASDVDMTGTWDLKVETPNGKGTPVFELKQEGNKLTGKYSGAFGESPVEGTVNGKSFEINYKSGGVAVKYSGEVEGSTVKGEVDYGSYGKGTFTGKKR